MWVCIGMVSFAIGGWIATYGWEVWLNAPEKRNLLRKGAWDLIRGTIVVALAGSLSTHGWNVISLGKQKRNLVNAVVQESLMNAIELKQPPMKGEVSYLSQDHKTVLRPFPTLRTSTLNGVLSSGLWSFGNRMERTFLLAVWDYEVRIVTTNNIFAQYNATLLTKEDPNEGARLAKRLQSGIPEKECYRSLIKSQNRVMQLIRNQYKWAIETECSTRE